MLPVTLTFAGAAALINLWLGFRISGLRRSAKILIGDGDNPALRSRMRAHANFVENTPFVLILMGLIELAGGNRTALWAAGFVYVAARIVHAFGMDRASSNPLRATGIIVTWAVLGELGLWAIWIASHPASAPHYL